MEEEEEDRKIDTLDTRKAKEGGIETKKYQEEEHGRPKKRKCEEVRER